MHSPHRFHAAFAILHEGSFDFIGIHKCLSDPSSAHTPHPAPHCFYPGFLGLRGPIAGGVDMQVRAPGVSSSILLCLVSDVLHLSSRPLSSLAISCRASSLPCSSFNHGLSCTSGLLKSLISFSGIRQAGALPSVTPVSGSQLSRSSPILLPRTYSKACLCCVFAIHHIQLSYSRSS